MNKVNSYLLLLLVPLICSGCSNVVKSSKVDLINKQGPIAIDKAGYYFLPRVKVRLEGERKALSQNEESEESTSTEKQSVKDEKAKTSTESTIAKTLKKSTIKSSAPIQKEVEKTACTIAIKDTITEPDPRYLYRLDHLRDYLGEDKVTVTLTPSGLLSKVDISAEDKSGEFVTKLAELAKESAKAFIAMAGAGVEQNGPQPFYFSVVIDPTDRDDMNRLQSQLDALGCPIKVTITTVRQNSVSSIEAEDLTPDASLIKEHNGIYFRPALPHTLTFEPKDFKSYGFRKIENTIYLPNKAPVMFLDFKRVAFGKYTHVVEFENGLLKQVAFNVPSSALGFMTIPIEVAKAIASIPGEILQLKFNVVSKEKDLLDKQAELIETQKKRLQADEALKKYIEELKKQKQDTGKVIEN